MYRCTITALLFVLLHYRRYVFLWRYSHLTLEYRGKIQRVVIAAESGDILNGGQALLYQCAGVLNSQRAYIIVYA